MKDNRASILQMAKGAIEERVDYEVSRVVENIMDMNTDPRAKRKVQLTIEFTPNEERDFISTKVTAKSTLAATKPISTALTITEGRNGRPIVAELSAQIPGQTDFDGGEQEQPKILKLARAK